MRDLIEYYDNLSEVYDDLYGGEQIVKYLKSLAYVRGDRVLDAGCGTGLGISVLYPRYVLCLDISLGMLKRALERGPNADYLVADVTLPPLRPASFHTALAITLFDDLREALRLAQYADIIVAERLGEWLICSRRSCQNLTKTQSPSSGITTKL